MRLRDIVGQDHIISLLTASLESGRISHAYLFGGPPGTGKATVAKLFAMALNCKSDGEVRDLPCGVCSSCKKMENYNHPDFKVIEPSGLSIKIDQIREVQRQVALKSYEGSWKVFFIKEADTMTPEAGNSLLKVLEEPAERSVLILTSDNYLEVLETIRSRCQIMEFRKIPFPLLQKLLVEQYSCPPEDAFILAGLSDGAIGRALQLKEDDRFFSLREKVLNILSTPDGMGIIAVLDLYKDVENVKEKEESREVALAILDILKTWYRDLIIFSYCRDASLLINQDKKDKIIEEGKHYSVYRLQEIIQKIEEVRYGIEKAKGANLSLALDAVFMEIYS